MGSRGRFSAAILKLGYRQNTDRLFSAIVFVCQYDNDQYTRLHFYDRATLCFNSHTHPIRELSFKPFFPILQNHQKDTIEDIEDNENDDGEDDEEDDETDDTDDDEDALLLLQNLGLQSLQSKTKR